MEKNVFVNLTTQNRHENHHALHCNPNPSTPFNHSPYYTVQGIFNRHSLLPSTFSLLSKSNPYSSSSTYRSLHVRVIDTAQLFDYKSKLAKEFTVSQHLKIAIVLCTHPMFGPKSASDGWTGLPFIFEKVRILDEKHRISRCEKFLNAFVREGCRMVEMSCEDHDCYAAGSQLITHTVGRILEGLMLESTPINRKGYESLLGLVENTAGDSFDLYYGLFMFNKNSLEMLEKLDLAFEDLRKQLIARLHHVLSSFTSKNSSQFDENTKLKIAIVGFGNFAQFLAKTIVSQGHEVLAYSRSDYSDVARDLGVSHFSDTDDLCEQHPEVISLCTFILSTVKVLKSLPFQRLKRSTLFVDVLSVKESPRNLFLQHLPPDFDVLCTHPMFGPESGKNG
ncbi:hypothetical protein AHAS_Ahas14G0073400 [Arachis hypogaea]